MDRAGSKHSYLQAILLDLAATGYQIVKKQPFEPASATFFSMKYKRSAALQLDLLQSVAARDRDRVWSRTTPEGSVGAINEQFPSATAATFTILWRHPRPRSITATSRCNPSGAYLSFPSSRGPVRVKWELIFDPRRWSRSSSDSWNETAIGPHHHVHC